MANNKFRSRKRKPNQENAICTQTDMKKAKLDKFCSDKVKSTDNDPQWYFKDKQILDDVASFSFNQPVGTSLRFNQYHLQDETLQNFKGTSSVPGIMAIRLGISPGVAESAQDPVNLGATNVYSYVRYKNSGASNYDAPDLMMYLLAMDSLYACWNWMQRIYGMATLYSQRNRYMPTAYLALNNVDFDDLMSNLADFRAYLNIKANEISAFCVPATMTYNVRHSWLFSNIFKDSDTHKAQQYMYIPAWFYKYDEMSSSKGGQLVAVEAVPSDVGAATKYKVKDLMNMLNTMLEAVNYSEDIGIMSGDIMKAYGESGLFTLSKVDADYRVDPVHSPEVLWQIENMQPLNVSTTDITQFNITQDPNTNYIKYAPVLSGVVAPRRGGYMNFHHNDVTPENVIVASRLKCSTSIDGGKETTTLRSVGSEFATNGYFAVFMPASDFTTSVPDNAKLKLDIVEIPFTSFPNISTSGRDAAFAQYLAIISMYTAFDWAPEFIVGFASEANSKTFQNTTGVIRDWDNYTYVDDGDIEAMNLLALLTEFNVPN